MTTDMNELERSVSGLASYFAGEPGVQAAWLFGSHAAGRSHRESDVDVAVLLAHGRFPDARARFEARVAMTADIIAVQHRNEVDLVVLNDAPPLFARRVVLDGWLVHCADADAEHAFRRSRCAVCRLRHHELLDAAHIVPDSEAGAPRVPNGLALCKLHHAAFDKLFVGVRPDGIIEVRRDILEEEDGPMLLHGLKRLHRTRLHAPRRAEDRPDPDLLGIRYERFVAAGC